MNIRFSNKRKKQSISGKLRSCELMVTCVTFCVKPVTQPSIALRLLDMNPQSLVQFKIVENRNWRIVFQNNYTLAGKVSNP